MKIKSEKGVTGIDITTGLIIFMISSVAIISLYIQIYKLVCETKIQETIIGYITEIFEEIDFQPYESNIDEIIQKANIPSQYTITTETIKYSDEIKTETGKDIPDVVKKIKINVKYTFNGKERNFTIYKTKVKE